MLQMIELLKITQQSILLKLTLNENLCFVIVCYQSIPIPNTKEGYNTEVNNPAVANDPCKYKGRSKDAREIVTYEQGQIYCLAWSVQTTQTTQICFLPSCCTQRINDQMNNMPVFEYQKS
jgi:hypothetical protein